MSETILSYNRHLVSTLNGPLVTLSLTVAHGGTRGMLGVSLRVLEEEWGNGSLQASLY